MNNHKFHLEKGSKKHTCPQCKKTKKFTRYIDTETGEYLAIHVGRCDRENNCNYHYPPSQFFDDNPKLKNDENWRDFDAWKTPYSEPSKTAKKEAIKFLPKQLVERTFKHYEKNNFIRYLISLFGKEKTFDLACKYHLGSSTKWKNDNGLSVVFWQIDIDQNVRQAKVMAYDPKTGKRLKAEEKQFVCFMGKKILKDDQANLQQCFFGEHLLSDSDQPVCLVESEKTAIIMAGIDPHSIWLATGGKNGARWGSEDVYNALAGRSVTLYPDLGAFRDWDDKAKMLITVCDYHISTLLEEIATQEDREAGLDIADYFINELDRTTDPDKELPENCRIVSFPDGNTLEVDGLPYQWLNEHEIMQALDDEQRANVEELIKRFDLVAIN